MRDFLIFFINRFDRYELFVLKTRSKVAREKWIKKPIGGKSRETSTHQPVL